MRLRSVVCFGGTAASASVSNWNSAFGRMSLGMLTPWCGGCVVRRDNREHEFRVLRETLGADRQDEVPEVRLIFGDRPVGNHVPLAGVVSRHPQTRRIGADF